MDFQSYSLIISYRISNVVHGGGGGGGVDIFWRSPVYDNEMCPINDDDNDDHDDDDDDSDGYKLFKSVMTYLLCRFH